jgi:chemotaxis protein methyltransferase CheR
MTSQPPSSEKKNVFAQDLKFSESDRVAIEKLSQLAHELTGVQLSERHQSMVTSRLGKRLIELGLESLEAYVEHFHAHRLEETPRLVGLLTTHHTYFFREFSHFEFIQNRVLPVLIPIVKARSDKKLRIWGAACSRGQEAYSLAMFLDFHLKRIDPSITFEIFGTDIDPESVEIAKNGVYLRSELKEAPLALLGDHWVKGTGAIEAYAKAKKSLRDRCRFQVGNLFELKSGPAPTEQYDLIFCRNVFIYFNSDQIKSITQGLLARLAPEGFFFIGISESLSGLKFPLESPGPSVYRHKAKIDVSVNKGKIEVPAKLPGIAAKAIAPSISAPVKLVRILCVDDSPSILTLMRKILSKENGFEVVGVAKNGIEASLQVLALKPDALTLDIHMPEQSGIEYLEKNFRAGHPPVVMVTSVSRENADLAGKALSLGAADYVEKPALTNLEERGEEIRNKLRCALLSVEGAAPSTRLALDKSFQHKRILKNPESKLIIISLHLSARKKLKAFLNDLHGTLPHCVLLVEGAEAALPHFAELLSKETGKKIVYSSQVPTELKPNEFTILDLASSAQKLWETQAKKKKTSVLVFGDVSKGGAEKLLSFEGAQLILEDLGSGKGSKALMDVANDVGPSTSFAYLSTEFLSEDVPSSTPKGSPPPTYRKVA